MSVLVRVYFFDVYLQPILFSLTVITSVNTLKEVKQIVQKSTIITRKPHS